MKGLNLIMLPGDYLRLVDVVRQKAASVVFFRNKEIIPVQEAQESTDFRAYAGEPDDAGIRVCASTVSSCGLYIAGGIERVGEDEASRQLYQQACKFIRHAFHKAAVSEYCLGPEAYEAWRAGKVQVPIMVDAESAWVPVAALPETLLRQSVVPLGLVMQDLKVIYMFYEPGALMHTINTCQHFYLSDSEAVFVWKEKKRGKLCWRIAVDARHFLPNSLSSAPEVYHRLVHFAGAE